MKIALIGDIAFLGRASISGNNNYMSYFSDIAQYLHSVDYVIGNLETPFSQKKKTYGAKSAFICANTIDSELLNILSVNAVTLANNHIFDFGKEGYELTKKILKSRNIHFFGVEGKEVKLNILGNKIALSGFCCYSSNPQKNVQFGEYGINEYNIKNTADRIRELSSEGYLPIIAVHGGKEHVNYPSSDTVLAARQLSKVAPFIFYGHHPHVVQGIEETNKSILAYSLGNFCFDDIYQGDSEKPFVELTENNRSSVILEIEIINSQIINWKTIPIYIGKDKIYMGKGVTEKQLYEYSYKLKSVGTIAYDDFRMTEINNYYAPRLANRTFKWVLRRLRPRYAYLMYTNYLNKKKYKKCITKQLIKHESL